MWCNGRKNGEDILAPWLFLWAKKEGKDACSGTTAAEPQSIPRDEWVSLRAVHANNHALARSNSRTRRLCVYVTMSGKGVGAGFQPGTFADCLMLMYRKQSTHMLTWITVSMCVFS